MRSTNETSQMAEPVQRQRQHYETIATDYVGGRRADAYDTHMSIWADRLLAPWVARHSVESRREQTALDPMCGHANLAPFLLRHTDKVVLNDLSPSMLTFINEDIQRRCRILPAGDAADLDLEDSTVDVVVISGGLHHARATLHELLTELWRVLRPGGMLLFGEPSDEFFPVRLGRRVIYRLSRRFDHETEQAFRHKDLRAAISKAGFDDIRVDPFGSVGYLLMAQVAVIPLLRRSKSKRLFQALLAFDRMIEGNRLTRNTCFALTGQAVKNTDRHG